MSHRSYREASKIDWGGDVSCSLSLEQINTGALLRIADATEKMASRYTELLNETERLKRREDEQRSAINRLYRRISSLKGVITKLRRKP